ncbi:hypothetical protein ACKFKF_26040 [Phormidesmis sp. 146-12]
MTPKATRDFIKRIFALASVAIAVFSLTTQRAIAAPFVLSDYSGNLYGQGTLTCSKDFYSPNPTRSPRNAMFFARANYTFVESYPRVGHDLKFQLNQTISLNQDASTVHKTPPTAPPSMLKSPKIRELGGKTANIRTIYEVKEP